VRGQSVRDGLLRGRYGSSHRYVVRPRQNDNLNGVRRDAGKVQISDRGEDDAGVHAPEGGTMFLVAHFKTGGGPQKF